MTTSSGPPVRALVAGAAALLLAAAPASAATLRGEHSGTADAGEVEALQLLATAAHAARERAFSGTQRVKTWHGGTAATTTHLVRSAPTTGLQVHTTVPGTAPPPAPGVDARLLPLLARRYQLGVVGTGRCAGRPTRVVEARRPEGTLAGRLELDRRSGLALRREVYDAAGRPVLTTAFTDVFVAEPVPVPLVARVGAAPAVGGSAEDPPWPSPDELPGGYARVPAPRPEHAGEGVRHLAWSDGLSTVSVFGQPGSLDEPADAGFVAHRVDATTVWVAQDDPERIVWNGGGQVFTLVSDAGHDDLLAAVRALPHDPDPEPGLLARLGRGLDRIGSWLDPRH